MYSCGLRIGEATTLEISAVDRGRRLLRIVGKSNDAAGARAPRWLLVGVDSRGYSFSIVD